MRWEHIRTYDLLNFTPTRDFVAVVAEEADDGFLDLQSSPLDGIGVARVTSRAICFKEPGKPGRYSDDEPEQYNVVVGLELLNGKWEIVNELSSFAGIARAGEDVSTVTAELDGKYMDRLRKVNQ